jgi:uroporphyrin-III C-methyltransferase/precorrin-2 dehydrogenase/sirohydrochlorin ferrochelatase
VAIIANGTLRGQRVVRCALREAAHCVSAAGIRPPAIVVIGPVVGLVGE